MARHGAKSLGVRLALLLAVTLFSVMSLVAWWSGRHQAKMLHHEEVEEAEALATALTDGLQTLMEKGEGRLVNKWLDRMQNMRSIEGIKVLSRDGSIAFRDTTTIDRVNRFLGNNRFHRQALPSAHASKKDQTAARRAAAENRRVILTAPGHLRLLVPIPFKPVCAGCHGYDRNPVRGILQLKFSNKNAESRVRDMRHTLWGLAALVSALLGLLLWLGLGRLVLQPMARLRTAMHRAGSGDRAYRLPEARHDELGEVAAGFNVMQGELLARNALIHAIVKHAPNAMITADRKGLIRSFNPAAERLFGYAETETLGQNVRMLMPAPYKSAHDGYIHSYLETGEPHIIGTRGRELEAQGKDGKSFPVELMVGKITLDDDINFLAIIHDITVRKEHETALVRMTLHDPLTGLPNRRALAERMDAAIAEDTPFALFYLGLNRFRAVNEVLGHSAGDQALMKTGKRLKSMCREGASTARIGGDIFAVFWPGIQESEEINGVVRELLDCMEQPLQLHRYSVDVDARIGIAIFPMHGKGSEDVLRRAEIAMDAAGRLQHDYVLYDESLEHYQAEHLTLAGELRHAIEAGELLLYYQPKVDMRSGRIVGVEALVRWQHPRKGFMQPDLFIPMAEETGLIHPFTDWVLAEGARQASLWHRQGIDLITSVNLAARNLTEADLPDRIHDVIRRRELPPDRLMLEITETGMMADPKRARDMLCRIHDMGIPLSIDDFGTGYSSLAYLKDLPVDEIKVDQSFVYAMLRDKDSETIVKSTIALAHNLGLMVTAEGVEDEDIWRMLAAMGCDKAQGYYMGRPMPPEELEQWLKDSRWGFNSE